MVRQFGGVHPAQSQERTKLILLGGLGFFLISGGLAYLLLREPAPVQKTQSAKVAVVEDEIKMVEVLIPVQEVKSGAPLEPRFFRKEERPQIGVSGRVVRSFEEINGHYARSLIVPGQPLHRDYITAVKPTSVLTTNIPEGFRAVTIRVDARTSVEGFVRPGAKVDVEWATRINGQPGIVTIVENAKVLSAERQTQVNPNTGAPVPSTLSLLVSSQDAKKIQLASTTGKLSLSLRGDLDAGGGTGGKKITTDDLLGKSIKTKDEDVEGTVTIAGEKWLLVEGKLVPASQKNK